MPVHPRGCGEYGSATHSSVPTVRFIPAGAGNTYKARGGCFALSVHPRGCGEYLLHEVTLHRGPGSSPRVRGILPALEYGPEYAGSSPRVRGILLTPLGVLFEGRFIPAGAGNTKGKQVGPLPHPVHPRGCGEYDRTLGGLLNEKRFIPAGAGNTFLHPDRVVREFGSSPRVRGIRATCVQRSLCPRFIPAGAGNTQMRQKRRARVARFIPAGAGNTHKTRGGCFALSVHPRGCGEYVCGQHALGGCRFIPAGAGNTSPGQLEGGLEPGSSPRVRGIRHRLD